MAQYIVNNTGELADYYVTSRFWNRHRDKLMQALSEAEVRPHHEAVLGAARLLEAATQSLLRRLQDLRLRLSLDHDVPYVAASPVNTFA
jgi:hypothetical protein